MSMTGPILIAAGGDIVQLLIVIVVIVITVIGKILAMVNSQNAAKPPVGPRPQRQEGSLQSQIEEFLRRAQRSEPAVEIEEPQTVEPVVESAKVATLVDDDRVGGRVGRQVRQYMDTSEFSRRTEELGEEVAQADEQFDQRAEQRFSGEVSRLAEKSGTAAAAAEAIEAELMPTLAPIATPGEGLVEMFDNPNNILQAIIMSEVLHRRWED